MRRLTMTTHKNPPRLGQAMKDLSIRPGSPCVECLVNASCTRSFVDKSACYEFAEFVQNIMNKAGKAGKSYADED